MATITLKTKPVVVATDVVTEEKVYGENAKREDVEKFLETDVYKECQFILTAVEAIRFPKGRTRSNGKPYEQRIGLREAVSVLTLAMQSTKENWSDQ